MRKTIKMTMRIGRPFCMVLFFPVTFWDSHFGGSEHVGLLPAGVAGSQLILHGTDCQPGRTRAKLETVVEWPELIFSI